MNYKADRANISRRLFVTVDFISKRVFFSHLNKWINKSFRIRILPQDISHTLPLSGGHRNKTKIKIHHTR